MGQIYKIFINEKTIFLESRQSTVNSPQTDVRSMICNYANDIELEKTIQTFATDTEHNALHIVYNEPKKVIKKIFKLYRIIKASGGLVKNPQGEILFIYRRNKWDLPKGKIEWRMEKKKQAAIREVEEECGIKGVTITRKLSPTFHMYTIKNEWVLKKTYWYEMLYTDGKPPIPEEKEDITKIKWFKKNEVDEVYGNTFKLIHELVENYLKGSQ